MPEKSQVPRALEFLDAVGQRDRTRIVCIYGLSAQVRGGSRKPLAGLYQFGRFSQHIEGARDLLPQPVLIREVDIEHPSCALDLGRARAILLVTPRGEAALVFDFEMNGEQLAERVAKVLEVTCLKKKQLMLDDKTVIDWLRIHAEKAELALPEDLDLGPNVHQCVFPGGVLLDDIRKGASYWQLIYRVAAPYGPEDVTGKFRQPRELNYQGYVAVGHGRGVSVLTGFSRSWQDIFSLVAMLLVTTLGVLHRSRLKLFDTMDAKERPGASIAMARTDISRLAARLNELQLDLEFGVEPYLDSVLIPESLIDAFQRSMSEAMGISSGLEHSSRMLERLSSVIQARQAALDAAVQEQAEERDKKFSLILAIGMLFALPPALLMAYFTLGPGGFKWLDPQVHWVAYLAAWLPFIGLVLFGWVVRRRVRAHSELLGAFERERNPGAL